MDDSKKRLQELVDNPREDLNIELKNWLDFSKPEHVDDLMKALMALANHGGGYVLLGFEKNPAGDYVVAANVAGSKYDQDLINMSLIRRNAEPAFHCQLYFVTRTLGDAIIPVLVVQGSFVPIRCKRDGTKHLKANSYYIRRPGPCSETPQTGQEWNEFIARCVRANRSLLVEAVRLVINEENVPQIDTAPTGLIDWKQRSEQRFVQRVSELPLERQNLFDPGSYSFSYVLEGCSIESLVDLLKCLSESQGSESGFPPWWVPTSQSLRPKPFEDTIECWLGEDGLDAAHSDFWRASRTGELYLRRGFQEESIASSRKENNELVIDPLLLIWRVAECLLHIERFALKAEMPEGSMFSAQLELTGIKDRRLEYLNAGYWPVRGTFRSSVTEARSELTGRCELIGTNLVEFTHSITKPILEQFDFFDFTLDDVRKQIELMRNWKTRGY
ncbi:MAG TPA: RNA-binding domain-containing protein [Drouetiella sp.]